MRILVAGQGRSGTSALFFKLKNSLGPRYISLFEPKALQRSYSAKFLLAKIIINDPSIVRVGDFDGFDKRILIVRDPRDNLISRILYAVYNFDEVCCDNARVQVFLSKLQTKYTAPASVSVLELIDVLSSVAKTNLLERYLRHHRYAMIYHAQRPDLFVYQYEDFLRDKMSGLDDFLGMALPGLPEVVQEYSRVTRRKSPGDWANWFLKVDIDYFRPIFTPYMTKYGYSDEWKPKDRPLIRRAHSIEYVARLVSERQTKMGIEPKAFSDKCKNWPGPF